MTRSTRPAKIMQDPGWDKPTQASFKIRGKNTGRTVRCDAADG